MRFKPLENSPDTIECPYRYRTENFIGAIIHFCPHCGTESYGMAMFSETDCKTDKELLQQISEEREKFNSEITAFRKIKHCPSCGAEFLEGEGYSAYKRIKAGYLYQSGLEPFFKEMQDIRLVQAREEAAKELDTLKNRLAVSCQVDDNLTADNLDIASDYKRLLPYIGHLITLEKGIYSLEQHLKELYESKLFMPFGFFDNKDECEREIQEIDYNVNEVSVDLTDYVLEFQKPLVEYAPKPQKPVFEMQKPTEPTYEVPTLFNKKKVLAENEAKKALFEKKKVQYKQAYEDFHNELESYEKRLEDWERDCYERNEAAVTMLTNQERGPYLERLVEVCREIDKLGEEWSLVEENNFAEQLQGLNFGEVYVAAYDKIALLHANLYSKKWNPEENMGWGLVVNEIASSERLIAEMIEARNKMYALNVIHPKYRNFVAISAFYDYLMTGRCSALTGYDGAYNLFEAESKTKLIMDKIADITASLEELKEGQSFLYQQVTEANKGIQLLNESMGKVVTHLAKMNAKADRMSKQLSSLDKKATSLDSAVAQIAENAEIAANYSQVTAFYAKRNAELTNALGYLVAFRS